MFRLLVTTSLSPHGRINRKGLLVIAVALFVVQLAVYGLAWSGLYSLRATGVQVFELVVLWLCLTAAVKRLHDVGFGGIWVIIGFGFKVALALLLVVGALLAFGQQALETGTPVYWWIVALTMVPAVAGTLWLHIQPGEEASNRFGDRPGADGYSPAHPSQPSLPISVGPA